MKTYTAHFTGRKVGAIGIRYAINTTVEAESIEDAKLRLYDRYEHIGQCVILPEGTKLTKAVTP